jgi:ribosomal protein L44E
VERAEETQQDSHVFVLNLRCIECGRRWDDVNERWRVYFSDDEPPDAVTYCPRCARTEFGD